MTPSAGTAHVTVSHDTTGDGCSPELEELIRHATAHDRHAPFGEHVLLTLDGQRQITHARLACHSGGRLAGYLVLREGLEGAWYADLVTHPRNRNQGVGTAMLRAAANHVSGHGGGALRTWAYTDGAPDAVAARLGMALHRAVSYQTRALAEVPRAVVAPPGTVLRSLRETEAAAWLQLSNQAFEGHPENGDWTLEDLHWRLSAPWTDLRRFVVLADAGTDALLGGVWTKVEPHSTDGELYVVAVHPDRSGQGLGRVLVEQALRTLALNGQATASLYVDTANAPAHALYASNGFTPQHTDRCFQLDLQASKPETARSTLGAELLRATSSVP